MSAMQMSVSDLGAFAAAVRPDWYPDDITRAILAASAARWPWTRILAEVTRMIADDDAIPADLLAAVRSPLDRPATWEAGVAERGAALARQALAEARGSVS